ncbi:LacI family DNA-binding transcriptional regulator [Spiractinospora alimapuensis]|uniref:LacI family DNA-binding transcriptional regulator n=1 Tax=Spiractinospora alimapuensis TaxID=2820884 RepID=UPI001F188F18|nr:LacI family DNA-binding transcriptional regulator [Spiractinospora alimapuensis]QVQ52883.1 LacI family DNA-binding transcriptional regulator [Spiractinospora alimapuensis]
MSIKLAEIATHAGVSIATVSRVLNDKSGVSTAKRQAVLTALDVLGYERPQTLRASKAGLIGLILPELSNPVFPYFAQYIESALMPRGYACVLCTHEAGGVPEDDYTELLLDRGVSGILFVYGMHADTRADTARYQRLIDQGLPIVLVSPMVPGVEAPFVSADEELSMELAVRHLASLGHRRIGIALGQERFSPVIRKRDGFLRTMRALGLQQDPESLVHHTLHTLEGGHAAATKLLDGGCTAICCANDTMAVGAIRAARERGLRVPEDVSVVGYDDSPLMPYIDPPLTTIRQPLKEMSQAAVAQLLDLIDGAESERGELRFRPELVVRSSTGPVG